MNEAGICPQCNRDQRMSGDSERFCGDDTYSTEYHCGVCEVGWTSYFKYSSKEVHE